jgi:hypothetical protein
VSFDSVYNQLLLQKHRLKQHPQHHYENEFYVGFICITSRKFSVSFARFLYGSHNEKEIFVEFAVVFLHFFPKGITGTITGLATIIGRGATSTGILLG